MEGRYHLKRFFEKNNVFYRLYRPNGEPFDDVNKYLEWVILQGNSYRSAAAYGYSLLNFFTWLDGYGMEFDSIEEYHLYDYIKYQREKGLAPRTINHCLQTVQAFYKFCMGESMPGGRYMLSPPSYYKGQNVLPNMGILPRRKVKRQLRVKVPHTTIKPLEVEEVKTFIRTVKKYRDLAIVYLMLSCGLRSIEVLNLKNENISYFTREVVIRGKGGKERLIYLPDFVIGIVDKYHQLEKPQDADSSHLFVVLKGKSKGQPLTRAGLREIFRYKRKISGIKRANPHRFRHTCGADLVRAGAPLRVIQVLFGHENINQTANYTNIFQQDIKDEVFRAYKKMNGRYVA